MRPPSSDFHKFSVKIDPFLSKFADMRILPSKTPFSVIFGTLMRTLTTPSAGTGAGAPFPCQAVFTGLGLTYIPLTYRSSTPFPRRFTLYAWVGCLFLSIVICQMILIYFTGYKVMNVIVKIKVLYLLHPTMH